MSKTLYEEAIADAKQLREVAEANAKNAIIESVTPKIREFIENQLIGRINESEDDHEEDDDDDTIELDESALLELVKMMGVDGINESLQDRASSGAVLTALRGATASMTGDQRRKLLGIASKAKLAAASIHGGSIDIARQIKENNMSSRNSNLLFEVDLNELSKERAKGKKHDMEEEDMIVSPKGGAVKPAPAGKGKPPGTKVAPKSAKKMAEGEYETYAYEGSLDDMDHDHMMEEEDPEEEGYHHMMEEEDPEDMQDDLMYEEDDVLDDPYAGMSLAESRIARRRALRESRVELDLGDVELDPDLVISARVLADEEPEGETEEGEPAADDDIFGAGEESDIFGDEESPAPAAKAKEVPVAPKGKEKLDEVYEIDENMLRRELFRLRNINESKNAASSMAKHFGGGEVVGEVEKVTMNKYAAAKQEVAKKSRENRALKGKLHEYRSAVETLREQLTDLNLFNAKLLYVNKLLQNKDLSTTQRRSIIEALDSAGTLREVKLLYKSLTESLDKSKAGNLSESFTRRALGSSSRPSSSASPRATEGGEFDRWARLAGINNK